MNEGQAPKAAIDIRVECEYSPERSSPANRRWFFNYHIVIANQGPETVKLLRRHWIITNAKSKVEEVEGPGVVGEQPVLEPGGSFEYSSGCLLQTSSGTMQGTYLMTTPSDQQFRVPIPLFALRLPNTMN